MTAQDALSLREILDYDPETGALTWRYRTKEMCSDNRTRHSWNTNYAGKPALNAAQARGYLRGTINGKGCLAHRVIWALVHGEWPSAQIDHINGDKRDNRLVNLRSVSPAENQKNMKRSSRNTSGVTGVSWSSRATAWQVHIKSGGKNMFLGHFRNFDEAVAARKTAEAEHGFHKNHGRSVGEVEAFLKEFLA